MASSQIATIHRNNHSPFVIAPTNMAEAMEYSKMIASSCFCPSSMKGKPGDIMIAMQMGAEIGLSPIQALQNVAVINGKPCVYGDAALAVVIGSPNYVSHREWFEGSIEKGNLTAFCGIIRRNSDEYVKSFSMDEAKKAGLWAKAGVWQQYPSRMLQMRARAFAIRDKFADALRGINVREEVEDYHHVEAKALPVQRKEAVAQIINQVEVIAPAEDQDELEVMFMDFTHEIEEATDVDALKKIFTSIKKVDWKETDYLKQLIEIKDAKKSALSVQEFQEEYDAATGEIKS